MPRFGVVDLGEAFKKCLTSLPIYLPTCAVGMVPLVHSTHILVHSQGSFGVSIHGLVAEVPTYVAYIHMYRQTCCPWVCSAQL